MSTQVELVQRILDLSKENPRAEIHFCVDNELADEWGWTAHKISRVELSCWIEINERIYTDEDRAVEEIMDMLFVEHNEVSDSDLESLADAYFNEHCIDAICVHTTAA